MRAFRPSSSRLPGLSSIRGMALLLTGGYSIPVDPNSPFNAIGRGWVFGVPVPAIIAVAILVAGYLAFNETTFGRYVTGIGANAEAVRRAGVNTRRVILAVYVLSGTRRGAGRYHHCGTPRQRLLERRAWASSSMSSPRSCSAAPACSAAAARWSARAGRADRRRYRQRPDPFAPVAFPYADRHRHHHPDRDLAELPPVPDRKASRLTWEMERLQHERNAGVGVQSGKVMTVLGPIPVGADGRHAHARAHPARHLELVETALLRQPISALAEQTARHLDARRAPHEPVPQPRQLRPLRRRRRCRGADAFRRAWRPGPSSIRPTSASAVTPGTAADQSRTGLHIVMGAGYYLEPSHPDEVKAMSIEDDRAGDRQRLRSFRRVARIPAPV